MTHQSSLSPVPSTSYSPWPQGREATISRRSRWLRTAPSLLSPLVWLTALWVVTGCGQEVVRPEAPVRAIRWQEVEATDRREVRRIAGTVKPTDESRLSFEVSGRVERVEVQLGDRVEAGEVLAALDPEPFRIRVRDAEARLKQAEAERWRQQAEFQRYRRMLERNVVSRSDFDRVRAAHESSESASRAAQAGLDLAERNLRKAILVAPFDGVVSDKRLDPFVEVEAGQPVIELDGEADYEVVLALPERIAMRSLPGDSVRLRFPTLDGLAVGGTVKAIGSRAGVADAFPAKLHVEDAPETIRPGMTAEAEFAIPASRNPVVGENSGTSPLVQVPIAALLAGENERYSVFVFDRDASRVRKKEVAVRDIRSNFALLEAGVAAGQVIATAGVEFLNDGQEVVLMAADRR